MRRFGEKIAVWLIFRKSLRGFEVKVAGLMILKKILRGFGFKAPVLRRF